MYHVRVYTPSFIIHMFILDREIFSPERGRILLPEIHKVEFDVVNENATEEFPYSGVRRFR